MQPNRQCGSLIFRQFLLEKLLGKGRQVPFLRTQGADLSVFHNVYKCFVLYTYLRKEQH